LCKNLVSLFYDYTIVLKKSLVNGDPTPISSYSIRVITTASIFVNS
jgi:hypothetical protein